MITLVDVDKPKSRSPGGNSPESPSNIVAKKVSTAALHRGRLNRSIDEIDFAVKKSSFLSFQSTQEPSQHKTFLPELFEKGRTAISQGRFASILKRNREKSSSLEAKMNDLKISSTTQAAQMVECRRKLEQENFNRQRKSLGLFMKIAKRQKTIPVGISESIIKEAKQFTHLLTIQAPLIV